MGFHIALQEITLVFFTTLAPVGIACGVLLYVFLLLVRPTGSERVRVNHMSIVPVAFVMTGIVASATHLGNPANALYVLRGAGHSPLSDEVIWTVVFLGLGGLYWLYSFALAPRSKLQNVWCILNVIAGMLSLRFIGLAYNEPTIITWSTVYVPANLGLAAAVGGPILFVLVLRLARSKQYKKTFSKIFLCVSMIALVANAFTLFLQSFQLRTLSNGFGFASDLAPVYPFMIAFYLICTVFAYVLVALPVFKNREASMLRLLCGTVVFFLGLFAIRFGFYMTHMTVGISF